MTGHPTALEAIATATAAMVSSQSISDVLGRLVSDCVDVMGASAVASL